MKTLKSALLVLGVLVLMVGLTTLPGEAQKGKALKCVTIQDGVLIYTAGHYLYPQPIKTGYDIFGYNYQAGMFNGTYANVYLGRDGLPPYDGDDVAYLAAYPGAATKWYWPYRKDNVAMKWDEGWMSKQDCDKDGLLDRHFGFTSYIGSGAWETNHQSGTYTGLDGKEYVWTYFVKIVAVPANAHKIGGYWYTVDGREIGYDIWGEFAVIQEIYNDNGTGDHGILYKSPVSPGLGKWK